MLEIKINREKQKDLKGESGLFGGVIKGRKKNTYGVEIVQVLRAAGSNGGFRSCWSWDTSREHLPQGAETSYPRHQPGQPQPRSKDNACPGTVLWLVHVAPLLRSHRIASSTALLLISTQPMPAPTDGSRGPGPYLFVVKFWQLSPGER